ncbi:MAG: cytochrome c [Pseudomonadota bacterium]
MNKRFAYLAFAFSIAGALSVGCGSDDDSTPPNKGGAGGLAGSAGKGGSSGSLNESGSAGIADLAGSTGVGGAAGDQGDTAGNGPGGQGGEGGAAAPETPLERGKQIVRSITLCGSCHTAAGGSELGGNPTFAGGLGAPNLTNDPSGIADYSDARVINAIKNGIALRKEANDQDRHLSSVMPYWLFHNMTDDDALAVVTFLRSLPPVAGTVAIGKADATPVTPLAPSSLPDTSLASTDPDYAAAKEGKYLLSAVAQCVKCHSPATGGLPSGDLFSGVPPANATAIFAPNITPHDPTGISGWTAADVVTALKVGTNKAGRTLCGSMPSGAKGFGGMSDADAHAIGVYLTTIPGVDKAATDSVLEPACP